MFNLSGKVALVTGANYGIGFEMAKGLAQAGATICYNGRNIEHVENAKVEYEKLGIKAYGYVCDVSDESQVSAMLSKIKQEVGTIDILDYSCVIYKNINSAYFLFYF